MNQNELKRAVAQAALAQLADGEVVGVGSGSTVDLFIDELAASGRRFAGAVSCSENSTRRMNEHGIKVLDFNEVVRSGQRIPVHVDGADEVDLGLRMIKGGGGALTREKIVAAAVERFVCIVDASKCVAVLGAFPLPIEVIPMALELVCRELRAIGATPSLRADFITDNGNLIVTAAGLSITDPVALESEINQWPGVVTNGLFARRPADLLLVASQQGVQTRTAQGA
ncbi:MAG: ribose-5-phosphate isomerase RpiA [Burkholderiaceae bacterium]|nr:ribose-5-phosphate isomerase RpiA [Burkholderiaceae bacterium]